MNYQLLALDLDGTLTNSKKEISKPTLNALLDIQKKGVKVVLASGRPTVGVKPLAEQLHLSGYGGYILSFNGGRITDCGTEKIIYSKLLPEDIASSLLHIVKKYAGVDILAYKENSVISGIRPNQYTELESQINHIPIESVPDFSEYITSNPGNKLLITGEPEIIEMIRREAAAYFRSYLNIYCSEPFFLEIMPAGIDKARSLLRLLTSIGMNAEEMICCGDGYNDLTMIETAGLGVAMANAQPILLEKADYITKSNDENGILHVINKFILGTEEN